MPPTAHSAPSKAMGCTFPRRSASAFGDRPPGRGSRTRSRGPQRVEWSAVTDQFASAAELDTTDQRAVRMDKRTRLLQQGVAPYPVTVERTSSLAQVRERFPDLEPGASTAETVSVAGRVIFVRNTGKLCFATLQETGPQGESVRLQAMLSLAEIGAEALADWKALVDLGDHVQVTGEVIASRRGELSVMADSYTVAS